MNKLIINIALLVVILLAGFWGFTHISKMDRPEPIVQENASVLLEKVKSVSKLITVEGYFSEIYDHKDYYWYDVSFLRKKALIKVEAKVSVGYDLTKAHFEIKPRERKLLISELPDAEILSIDTDISYYDLSEGYFNAFTADELTQLNRKAKELIEEKAKTSGLLQSAFTQANQMLELIELIAQEAGFTVEYTTKGFSESPPPDTTFQD